MKRQELFHGDLHLRSTACYLDLVSRFNLKPGYLMKHAVSFSKPRTQGYRGASTTRESFPIISYSTIDG